LRWNTLAVAAGGAATTLQAMAVRTARIVAADALFISSKLTRPQA
jgi:hypothetical protein